MCDVQTLKKFTDRPSPPRAASDPGCQGKTFKGNDGNDWISKPTVKGVYRWTKIVTKAPKAAKVPKAAKTPKSAKTPKAKVNAAEMKFKIVLYPALDDFSVMEGKNFTRYIEMAVKDALIETFQEWDFGDAKVTLTGKKGVYKAKVSGIDNYIFELLQEHIKKNNTQGIIRLISMTFFENNVICILKNGSVELEKHGYVDRDRYPGGVFTIILTELIDASIIHK